MGEGRGEKGDLRETEIQSEDETGFACIEYLYLIVN